MFSVSSLAAVGSVPKARAVALAIANKPQSQRLVCYCGIITFTLMLSQKRFPIILRVASSTEP